MKSQWLTGVEELVDDELGLLKDKLDVDPSETMAILGCLALTHEALTVEQFKEIHKHSDLNLRSIDKVIKLGRNLFQSGFTGKSNEQLIFGHPQYHRAILKELSDHEIRECHEQLARGCDQWKKISRNMGQEYCLKYRIVHWLGAVSSLEDSWLPIAKAFADMEYIQERSKEYGFAGIYHDALEAMRGCSTEKHPGNDWGDWPQAYPLPSPKIVHSVFK
ncbi:MAG: hypothetical protein FWH27_01035 [Planctomycetaceae bacterium]|nr:hypothetical protein [Planctomycetaceae bacterium]